MTRSLIRFMLCMLIAALPLQGFAAAVKLCCGPARTELSHAVADQSHEQMHSAPHDHQHEAKAGQGAHDHGKASGCSACADCCVGAAALPSRPHFSPVFLTAPAIAPAPAALLAGYIPDGIERPPRP